MPVRHDDATGMSGEGMAEYSSYDASSLPPDLLDLVHHTEAELRRLYKAAQPRRESRHARRPARTSYTEDTSRNDARGLQSRPVRPSSRGAVRTALGASDDRSALQDDLYSDTRDCLPHAAATRRATGMMNGGAQDDATQWERHRYQQQQQPATLSTSPLATRRALNITASSLVQERRRRRRQERGGPTTRRTAQSLMMARGTLYADEKVREAAARRTGRPWARALRDLLPCTPSRSTARPRRDVERRAGTAVACGGTSSRLNQTPRRGEDDAVDDKNGEDEMHTLTSVVSDSEVETRDDDGVDEDETTQPESTAATPRRGADAAGARVATPHGAATAPSKAPPPSSAVVHDTTSASGTVAPLPASRLVRHDLVEQLRGELAAQAATLRAMRVRHAKEVAALREASAQIRADTARETREQLAGSYAVTQSVLQAAVETERQRAQELDERLRALRQEQRILQKRHDTVTAAMATQEEMLQRKENELQALHTRVSQLQSDIAAQTEARLRHAVEAKLSKEQVTVVQDKEASLAARVRELQERLTEQEHTAKETLRQLEAEFTRTSNSYQELLGEATDKVSKLQGVQRRYKQLRDAHAVLMAEKERLVTSGDEQLRRQSEAATALRTELDALREKLAQSEARLRDEAAGARATREELARQLEQQKASAQTQEALWTQRLETANHTIQVLRTQLTGTQQEATEEQAHAEALAMQTAEREMKLQKELSEQRRAAAAYKVRAEDTIASLKRQIREKDTKLQALVATSAEPLQRLRTQLAEERTRRGAAEEQLKVYKSKAKEAEERALREMRREQLRGGLLDVRATGRDSLVPRPRAAQARRSSSAQSATVLGATGKDDAQPHSLSAQSGLSWSARTRARSAVPPPSQAMCALHAESSALSVDHNATAVVASSPPRHRTAEDHSPPRVQITAIADLATHTPSPLHATTSMAHARDAGAATGSTPGAPHAATTPTRQDVGGTVTPSEVATKSDTAQMMASAEKENVVRETKKTGDLRRPRPSLLNAAAAANQLQSPGHPEGGPNTSLESISVTPIPTAGSLSGISLSSAAAPSSSGSRRRRVAAAAAATSGTAISRQSMTKSAEAPATDTRRPADAAAQPLRAVGPADADEDDEQSAVNVRQWRGVYQRCGSNASESEAHEQRMRDFHASAADVLRKITNRREEFLAQCASIIQHSAASARPRAVATEELDMVDSESNATPSGKA